MTDKQIAVKVDHVSKYFKLPTESTQQPYGLPWSIVLRELKVIKNNTSLSDISFEVEKGDFYRYRRSKWFWEIDPLKNYF